MEDDTKKPDSNSETIEEIMRARGRLDQVIEEKFKKKMTILFSDICGYTKYMDTKGDIAGRAWVQRHHDIVIPLIEEYGGNVLDIMGDGIMASFSTTLSAVKATIAIQKGLETYNNQTNPADEIHVSMGINTGEILVDGTHIAGDVVNVASRIESQADRDQILISKSAYEDVSGSDDVLCRAHATVSVKGKPQPLELYRVVWRDEEIILSKEPRVRTDMAVEEKEIRKPISVLQLEMTRDDDRLKISVSEQMAGEVSTIRHYEEIPIHIDKIGVRCNEIVATLNNANRKGHLTRDVLMKLREVGQVFRDELFTLDVKDKLKEAKADHLIVNIDDQLVHIPWELLHDGTQFLCQRFNMGRLVKTRQAVPGSKTRLLARPLKMLVISDPKGDLQGAYEEGTQIRDYMDRKKDLVSVSLRSDDIKPDYLRKKLRNFDLIHFAGHAEYNPKNPGESGWQLTDGIIKAQDITMMSGTAAMPALIFSNACQSARTEEWNLKQHFQNEIFGLANAFLLTGAKHYVGTFWEVLDKPSRLFALEFYKQLLEGVTIGEAIRLSRLELIKKYGEETIVWASYLLYGDPTFNYLDQIKEMGVPDKEASEVFTPKVETEVRAREEEITFGEAKARKVSKGWWGAVAGVIILALLLFGYLGIFKTGTGEYENLALTHYQAGKYAEAIEACEKLQNNNPGLRLTYVILGNIRFMEGDLKRAEALFEQALKAEKGTEGQKAEALMGLGRIASVRNNTAQALDYYQQAAKLAPDTGQAYASQAILLNNEGRYDEALSLFKKANALSPDDRGLKAIANNTVNKIALSKDEEKQKRIDKLVQELLSSMEKPIASVQWDGWTSLPLTLWMMDFETRGHNLQEGKETIIASCIVDHLIEKSRAQIVERAILDKLMKELKLSTTKLVDRSTALSLGKIMAARLILSGQVFHSGSESQITIRFIETETGQITGAVNEVFGSAVPPSTIADKLSGIIVEKLKSLYPLKGKISEINGNEITLNIGKRQGVKVKQPFKVKDTDWVLEVFEVEPEFSTAKLMKGAEGIKTGLRVEAL